MESCEGQCSEPEQNPLNFFGGKTSHLGSALKIGRTAAPPNGCEEMLEGAIPVDFRGPLSQRNNQLLEMKCPVRKERDGKEV